MCNPDFSVLISVYFRETCSNLETCLKSILEQSLPPSEIVIVKDGPLSVEMNELLANFERCYSEINLVSLNENVGLAKALNFGISHCRYDFIARMDSDDIAHPDRFEKQFKIFRKYPQVQIVGSWVSEFTDDTCVSVGIRKVPEFHHEILKFSKLYSPFNHPTVVFRKQTVVESGGYDPLFLQEDYHLWMKLLSLGTIGYNIQESLVFMRTNNNFFNRRRGLKYAINEASFMHSLYRQNHISFIEFTIYGIARFLSRMLGAKLLKFLYKNFLRK